MPINTKHLIFLLSVTLAQGNEELVDYYENLITEEIGKSQRYQFPKDASEYKTHNENDPKYYGEFDYVIVGGGSSGSVIASRLSEVRDWKILLLEAGEVENNFTELPAMNQFVQTSQYNWGFNSTQRKTCCLNADGMCIFSRGRVLGGTSVLSGLVYSRGNKADYNKWASLGNPGWSYEEVLPLFKRSEDSHIKGDPGYHGFDGYLNIEYHRPTHSKTYTFLNGLKELGQSIVDYNGRNQLGSGFMQYTLIDGKRESVARAFLKPVLGRKNLKILTNSYVTKILISDVAKKACGVLFSHKNTKYLVRAKKEIIISGGAVGSTQLLLLSGVGSRNRLKKLKIPLKMDLSVGEKLYNHFNFPAMIVLTSVADHYPNLRGAIKQFLYNESGPLTLATGGESVSHFQVGSKNTTVPDIELVLIPSSYVLPDGLGPLSYETLPSNYADPLNEVSLNEPGIRNRLSTFIMVSLHPKSVGRIYLKSNDPYEYPIINSNCLDDPESEDIKTLLKGVQFIHDFLNTRALKAIDARLLTYLPCCQHPTTSKEYWTCFIRSTGNNAFHPIAVCPMGPDPSKGAVVDNELRVHGIKNLRVADCSVIPITLSNHVNAAAIMIGEKLAELIRKSGNRFN